MMLSALQDLHDRVEEMSVGVVALSQGPVRARRLAAEIQRRRLLRKREELLDVVRLAELREENSRLKAEIADLEARAVALGIDPVTGASLPIRDSPALPAMEASAECDAALARAFAERVILNNLSPTQNYSTYEA